MYTSHIVNIYELQSTVAANLMSDHTLHVTMEVTTGLLLATIRRKILTVENIDEFDEFSAIRQYFPYQNFPFS